MNLKNLNHTQPNLCEQFKRKVVEPLKEEIHEHSFKVWIEPLCPISYKDNVLTLYVHDYSIGEVNWIKEHYGKRIKELLNKDAKQEINIEFTNDITEKREVNYG